MSDGKITINEEYCWGHTPGGWDCVEPECAVGAQTYDLGVVQAWSALQDVPAYAERYQRTAVAQAQLDTEQAADLAGGGAQ